MRGMNMGNMMKQAQQMQKKMGQVQEDLAKRVVEGSAGGGMVNVQVSGKQELLNIKIDKEVVDPDDVTMLEDLILAAVNQGMKNASELAEKEMGKVTGGMNIPGLM